jgi:hypothetical protein
VHQVEQHIEDLWFERNGLGAPPQLSSFAVKDIVAKDSLHAASLEHFPEKWTPVFRKEMRQTSSLERFPATACAISGQRNREAL